MNPRGSATGFPGLRAGFAFFVAGGIALFGTILHSQEFHYGLTAPEALRRNTPFDVTVSISSMGIPAGSPGVSGWTLAVAHEGLEILSATIQGTAAADLLDGGFELTEITASDAAHPGNDGFICAVLLSLNDPGRTLPPSGTVTAARGTYRAGDTACRDGARIIFKNGLVGSGQPVRNVVTWKSETMIPQTGGKTWDGCAAEEYVLGLQGPADDPIPMRLRERLRIPVQVHLRQGAPSASAWNLSVAHDPTVLRIVEVSIQGTDAQGAQGPGGFALFEITSGAGNAGFTAQVELSGEPGTFLPVLEGSLARALYEMQPVLDPARVLTQVETALRLVPLRGSGGPITNQVLPAGSLALEPVNLRILILPEAHFQRGDSNGDGLVDLADPLAVLFHLFASADLPCPEGANGNDDGRLDISDAIYSLQGLFTGGPAFPAPSPECGTDLTLPTLGCGKSPCP